MPRINKSVRRQRSGSTVKSRPRETVKQHCEINRSRGRMQHQSAQLPGSPKHPKPYSPRKPRSLAKKLLLGAGVGLGLGAGLLGISLRVLYTEFYVPYMEISSKQKPVLSFTQFVKEYARFMRAYIAKDYASATENPVRPFLETVNMYVTEKKRYNQHISPKLFRDYCLRREKEFEEQDARNSNQPAMTDVDLMYCPSLMCEHCIYSHDDYREYKKKALQSHPDKVTDPNIIEVFKNTFNSIRRCDESKLYCTQPKR